MENGIGISTHDDLVAAAREAGTQAKSQCASPAVVLVFATDNYPAAGLVAAGQAAAGAFASGTLVAGGTVPGISFAEQRFDALHAGRAVAVLAVGGSRTRAAAALAPDAMGDPQGVGRRLAESVRSSMGMSPTTAILLSPGVIARPHPVDREIVAGVEAVLPGVQLAGGGLGGGMQGTQLLPGHAFVGAESAKGGALFVAFGGVDGKVGLANGLSRDRDGGTISELASPTAIRSIDGRPARDVALELLAGDDPRARDFLAKSTFIACIELGITLAEADPRDGSYWPHIPGALTADGGMVDFFGPRPGGHLVVARMDRQACLAAVEVTAEMLGGKSVAFDLVMSFSCALRGLTLGPKVAAEDMLLRQKVQTRQHFGLTVHGEIGRHWGGSITCTGWSYSALGLRGL